MQPTSVPLQTLHLFPVLDKMLIALLQSLTDEEWNLPTVARLWTVKDVASHLLDGNLRGLSSSRDKFAGEASQPINSYSDLVSFINQLNASWTNATKRLSPKVLTDLLEVSGKHYSEHLNTMDPFENAVFSVVWAGQDVSPNWFHIAREYTEKFLHQQQIRDAVGRQGLLTKELFFSFINTFMHGLPYTYKHVWAPPETVVTVYVDTEIGGQWNIIRNEEEWKLIEDVTKEADATVRMAPYDAWKLFSKSVRPEEVLGKVEITGYRELGAVCLQMVSVMA